MKTAQELLDQAMSREDQNEAYQNYFDSELKTLPDHMILVYHSYTYGHYEGQSYGFGFDTEKGLWFEVAGGHCSCYGLEGQWDPDYSTFEQLCVAITKTIDVEDYYSAPNNDQELQDFVGYHKEKK